MTLGSDRNELKETLWTNPAIDLSSVLQLSQTPGELVQALLRAAGFPYVRYNEQGDSTRFFVGHVPTDLEEVLRLDNDCSLHGRLSNLVSDVFRIVRGLEGELTDALYLPPEIRARRVEDFRNREGLDRELFSTVIRNW